MSIETLLEAAKFLEWRAQATEARDEGQTIGVKDNIKTQGNSIPDVTTIDVANESSKDSTVSDDLNFEDRERRRSGGAGTREVHNKLEKNRRAHLKECFDVLKKHIPNMEDKKTSNLCILRSALRYIQVLKRKEKEYEHEMERLAREKISYQQKLARLKIEFSDHFERRVAMPWTVRSTDLEIDEDQVSTSTASEGEDEEEHNVTVLPPPLNISSNFPTIRRGVPDTNTGNEPATSRPVIISSSSTLPVVPKTNRTSHVAPGHQSNLSPRKMMNTSGPLSAQIKSPHINQSVGMVTSANSHSTLSQSIPKPATGLAQHHIMNSATPQSFQQLLSAQSVANHTAVTLAHLSVPSSIIPPRSNLGQTVIHNPLIPHPSILPMVTTAVTHSLQHPMYGSPVASVVPRPLMAATVMKPPVSRPTSTHGVSQASVSQASVDHTSSVQAVPVTISSDSLKSITVNH